MILDGGLSNALVARGHDLSDELWTAALLRDAPEEIAAVHRAYFAAGAEVATTASYQASVPGFERAGLSRGRGRGAGAPQRHAGPRGPRRARRRRAARLVAASVGPYGAVLADGSEYRGRYGLAAARLRDFHLPRLELLASAGPDLLAVETIPDLDEAAVLVDLLDELGVPGLAVLLLRRARHPGRPAARRGVRGGRRQHRGGRDRGELLRPRGRAPRARDRPRGHAAGPGWPTRTPVRAGTAAPTPGSGADGVRRALAPAGSRRVRRTSGAAARSGPADIARWRTCSVLS